MKTKLQIFIIARKIVIDEQKSQDVPVHNVAINAIKEINNAQRKEHAIHKFIDNWQGQSNVYWSSFEKCSDTSTQDHAFNCPTCRMQDFLDNI
jgi:hypothetical protein